MLSPALGDFLQLRYVDLGPRPDPADDRSRPVRRIVADLMTAQETAGRSHFALIVIVKSATTIEELLGSCAAEPFLTQLRMRVAGIASTDDRQHGNCSADITSSPEGTWRDEKNLIDALRQRCEELPRYFAARGEPGLTRARLAALRHDHALAAAEGDGPGGDAGSAPTRWTRYPCPTSSTHPKPPNRRRLHPKLLDRLLTLARLWLTPPVTRLPRLRRDACPPSAPSGDGQGFRGGAGSRMRPARAIRRLPLPRGRCGRPWAWSTCS